MADDKRTASQRIEDLEKAVMSGFQVSNNMARDIMIIKDALKLLGNKVDSIMKASVKGEALTNEVISKFMLENNIEELKSKVTSLVNQGILAPTDTVGDNTFLVGSENEATGKVVHPRVQFTYGSLEKDLQDALKGKRQGDIVTFKEDKLRFVINEVYNIVPPKAPEAPTPAQAPAPLKAVETETSKPVETFAPEAPAAPAAEQSSSDASQAAPAADQSGPSTGN
jgi:hypothetical protein